MYYTDTERLTALINFLEISPLAFSKETGIPSATIYNTMNGVGTGLSKANLRSIAKRYTQISPGWLLTGEGEMLKLPDFEKKTDEDWPLEAALVERFSSNLRALVARKEMLTHNLAPLINIQHATLNQLLEGSRAPTLSMVVRLHHALEVSLDALLFGDLTSDNLMGEITESGRIARLEAMMEEILKRLEKMDKKDGESENEGDKDQDTKQGNKDDKK